MTDLPVPDPASTFWIRIFVFFVYALMLGCVYHAARVGALEYERARQLGYPPHVRVSAALTWLVFLALFAVLFWALESWAHFRTPFYLYDKGFPDLIPRIPFRDYLSSAWQPIVHECSTTVQKLMKVDHEYRKIPLSIPLLESALIYCTLWIAMLMGVNRAFAPLLAGLLMVDIDALLDPVVAADYACVGAQQNSIGGGFGQAGLGLWNWYYPDPNFDRIPSDLAIWFGVPLFNYAAWWAAPVVLGSLVMVFQSVRGRWWARLHGRRPREEMPTAGQASFTGAIGVAVLALYFLVMMAPNKSPGVPWQWAGIAFALLLSAGGLIIRVWRRELEAPSLLNPADPSLTRPIYFFLLLGFGAMVLEAVFLQRPGLIVVAVGSLVIGSLLTWWPYPRQIVSFCKRVLDAGRFVRIHYLGFPFMLALLGGFSLGIQNEAKLGEQPVYALALGGWRIGALLGVALCFHVWAFVVNDVTDWFTIECDQERRVHDPLGEGRIAPSRALALAAVSATAALFLAFLMDAGLVATGLLVAGMLLSAAYGVWGKRSFFPLLTDAMQAGGYACLALFAAKAVEAVFPAEDGSLRTDHWLLPCAVAGWGAGYILITTLLGGLRDLAYDRACGNVRTTAMLLGAEVDPSGTISNARIVLYAFGVHVAMFALPTIVLFSSPEIGGEAAHDRVLLALYGLGAISLLVLGLAVWPHQPRRYRWIAAHQLILALPAAGAFLPFLDLNGTYVLLTAFFAPYLVQEWIVYRVLAAIHPEIAADAIAPPGARVSR